MRFLLAVPLYLSLVSFCFSATLYVPDQYASIQQAISASQAGDTVVVRPGTYFENIDFMGKAVTLRSEQGPEVTTIDGSRAETVVLFANNETASSVLSEFTITNGTGTRLASWNRFYGGGVRCEHASPVIEKNIIEYNSVRGGDCGTGGGLYLDDSDALVKDNIIRYNAAWNGGGLTVEGGFPIIERNRIYRNYGWNGGGVNVNGGGAWVRRNEIFRNETYYGGGGIICSDYTTAKIDGNVIYENDGGGSGAGLSCTYFANAVIMNNLICNNYHSKFETSAGGGIQIVRQSSVTVLNNTVVGNSAAFGGGLVCMGDSTAWVLNSIFWDNSDLTSYEIYAREYGGSAPSTVNIGHSVVLGGREGAKADTNCIVRWGSGNISLDPRFGDETGGDYHIRLDSPCIDAGFAHSSLTSTDFEDDRRVTLNGVDIGCDEFSQHLYFTGTAFPGESLDVSVAGGPGMAVALALGAGVHENPVPTPYGSLFLTMPPAYVARLGAIPGEGILKRRFKVPSNWCSDFLYPFQALVGAPSDPRTVLSNLAVLDLDEKSEPIFEYKHDDGFCEDLYGISGGGDMCCIQRFKAVFGAEAIASVSLLFGSYVYPMYSPPEGHPCEVFLWDDPKKSGHPSDWILLVRETTTASNVGKNIFKTVAFRNPARVSRTFYVGCKMTHHSGFYCVPIDSTSGPRYIPGSTYFCGSNVPGTFDPENLMSNPLPPADAGFYACIRAGV